MDFPSERELFANQFEGNIELMRKELNVDSLAYLELDNLVRAIQAPGAGFCTACLTGQYPVQVPGELLAVQDEVPGVPAAPVRAI
jgi:amidophosphoribosyltransferase